VRESRALAKRRELEQIVQETELIIGWLAC